jgi:hypothetical protein
VGGGYLVEERKAVEEGEQARGGGGEVGSRALADGPPEFGRHRRFEPLHGEPVEWKAAGGSDENGRNRAEKTLFLLVSIKFFLMETGSKNMNLKIESEYADIQKWINIDEKPEN